MKQKLLNRALSGCLALALTVVLAVPAFAGGITKYKTENGPHEIRWTQGLADLNMPEEDREGDFTPGEISFGGETVPVWQSPFQGSQGWFDLTQKPGTDEKGNETYSSGAPEAAANLTYWWLMANASKIQVMLENCKKTEGLADPFRLNDFILAPAQQDPQQSPIYQIYLEAAPKGTEPDLLLDLFLNGYTPGDNQNSKDSYVPSSQGGFLYPVVKKELLTARKTPDLSSVKKAIAENYGTIIAVDVDGTRYMNLWGMETDESGKLCALYVTDSRDQLGMVRYPAAYEDQLTLAGKKVTALYTLSLGETLWADFLPEDAQPEAPDPGKPEPKPENQEPEQPQWEAATYEWSADLKTCTASRTMKNGEKKVETEKAKVSKKQTQAPTVKDAGIMTYTADFQADWAETQTRTQEIPRKEASWNEPTYAWSEDLRICYAKRTSAEDPSVEETAEAGVTAQETRSPTCLKKGQTTYTAEFDVDWAQKQEKVLDNIDTLTPNWGETTYQWASDYSSCTAKRVCSNEADGSHVETAKAKVTSEQTRKPTSSRAGVTTYKADFDVSWASQQVKTAENVPALDVSWNAPTYEWSEDLRVCYAKRVDRNDENHVETAEVGVRSEQTKAPTCLQKGETTYTAAFEEDWAGTQTLTKANIEKLTPNWGETEYMWSEDHHKCTAIRTCKNEKGHEERSEGKVSSQQTGKPTADQKGETTYTAKFDVDWAETRQISVRDIDRVADKWKETTYEWSSDNTKCTAVRVNAEDPSVKETARGHVTSRRTKNPTTTSKGETTYTATFDQKWATTQKKSVYNIPALSGGGSANQPSKENSWNEPTYEWSEDYKECTARRTRKDNASKVETVTGKVTKKQFSEATCAKGGEIVYTAKFHETWAKTQTKKVTSEPLEHQLQKVAEVPATAAKAGIREHYECAQCHKLFADAKGEQEVTKDQLRMERPSASDGCAVLNGVPEKDSVVSTSAEKFVQTLKDNPGSKGVSVAVGTSSVSYSQKDVETIEKAAGDHKIQLEIYKTDATDSALTPDQIRAAEQNRDGDLYIVELRYVKNNKEVPIEGLKEARVTLPYAENGVKVFAVAEDGKCSPVSGSQTEGFVSFEGGYGVYLLSQSSPSAPAKHQNRTGVIIWSVVLVISGLLCVALVGFYFYQKKFYAEEEAPAVPENPRPAARTGNIPGFTRPVTPAAPVQPEIPEDPDFTEEDFAEFLADPDIPAEDIFLTETPEAMEDFTADFAAEEKEALSDPMPHKPTIAEKTAEHKQGRFTKR